MQYSLGLGYAGLDNKSGFNSLDVPREWDPLFEESRLEINYWPLMKEHWFGVEIDLLEYVSIRNKLELVSHLLIDKLYILSVLFLLYYSNMWLKEFYNYQIYIKLYFTYMVSMGHSFIQILDPRQNAGVICNGK